MSNDLTKRIPDLFINNVDDLDSAKTIIAMRASAEMEMDQAYFYLKGFSDHHALIGDDSNSMKETGSNLGFSWYKSSISKVEVIERKSNGRVVGTKVRLHLAENKKGEVETIDTGWLTSPKWYRTQNVWAMALANTIKEVAEEAVENGNDIILCKHVYSGADNNNQREVVYVREHKSGNDADEEETEKPKAKSRSKKGKGLEVTEDDVSFGDKLEDEDIDDINEIILEGVSNDMDEDEAYGLIEKRVASLLEIKVAKLEEADEEAESLTAFAVSLMNNNI